MAPWLGPRQTWSPAALPPKPADFIYRLFEGGPAGNILNIDRWLYLVNDTIYIVRQAPKRRPDWVAHTLAWVPQPGHLLR